MGELRRYRKKATSCVVAVRLDLETTGFRYHKWGGEQTCKPGDWLVDNDGDTYTVDADVFARTYRQRAPGVFVKTTTVWATIAAAPGAVTTKEGISHYHEGDFIVYNDQSGCDAYCVSAAKFASMYEPDE